MAQDDRRNSFRCPVATEDEPAILRTDCRDLVVAVYEKSAEGYGVSTEQDVKITPGKVFSLATSSGCCEVEVKHVQRGEHETRIGLKVLRDLKFLHGGLGVASMRRFCSSGSNVLQLAAMMLLCGGFFVWGATLPVEPWIAQTRLPFFGGDSGATASAPNPDSQQVDRQIAMSFLQLDGLTDEHIVAVLDLSPRQSEEIRGIVGETTAALSTLYNRKQSGGAADEWPDLGMRTIHASSHRIQQVLTTEQRARWDALLEGAKSGAAGKVSVN